jgi:4-hydroxy-3-polyprenylbenzoate decarboxylase
MYRVQLLGKRTMAMHWHMHHDGARHWRSWKKRGKPMPVAVVLGGESVMPYAATAPLPPGISELLLAGFLNRGGIPMCMGKTVPIWVPANAEIVIEGYVSEEAGAIGWDPRNPKAGPLGPGAVFEGPFGDHTGFYSLPDRYPILTVTAITMRRDAIYPTTVVGLPPQEDYFLGKATERLFFPLLKTIIHDIDDYDLPMFGAFHNAAALQIHKAYPLQGRRVMHSVWGAGQMAWTKTLFSVESDVSVHDTRAVFDAVARNCNPHRDVESIRGPLDILDHAAPHLGAGTKIGFDATRRIEGEQAGAADLHARPAPADLAGVMERVRAIPGVLDVATAFGDDGWLLVRAKKDAPGDGRRVIAALEALGTSLPPFAIILGPDVDIQNTDEALFHWCAHSDAGRDSVRIGIGNTATLAFDATPKLPGDEANLEPVRPWPPVLTISTEIQARIRARWTEYGLGDAPVAG